MIHSGTIGNINKNLNNELKKANKKLDKIKEYLKITYQEWYNWKEDILSIIDEENK